MTLPAASQSEVVKRGYSDEEVVDRYELGKLLLESGQYRRAEAIFSGLNEVAPQFAPAWLGTAYLRSTSGTFDGALSAAKQALRLESESLEAMLFVAAMSLTLKDFSTAGTYLGEVGERIEQGKALNPNVTRFFKMQMARYQGRG